MVAVEPVSLNRATDTSPLARGLARTSRPPLEEISVPCLPMGSWSMAVTFLFVRMLSVVGLALVRLVPEMRGAAISDQRENSLWSSVVLMPLPISSMSGSFQWPGPAYGARATFWWKMLSMLAKPALMSVVVRQELPTPAPQVQTFSWPQLHRENRMGRPVACRALRMVV